MVEHRRGLSTFANQMDIDRWEYRRFEKRVHPGGFQL